MNRYIAEEAIIKAIDESGQRYGITTANQCNFKEIVRKIPTANVVPNSEAENYKQIAENQQKLSMDRYFEINHLKEEIAKAKTEVAREIFAEIDVMLRKYYNKCSEPTELKLLEPLCQAERFIINEMWHDVAELKKKYMEGRE